MTDLPAMTGTIALKDPEGLKDLSAMKCRTGEVNQGRRIIYRKETELRKDKWKERNGLRLNEMKEWTDRTEHNGLRSKGPNDLHHHLRKE